MVDGGGFSMWLRNVQYAQKKGNVLLRCVQSAIKVTVEKRMLMCCWSFGCDLPGHGAGGACGGRVAG